MKVHPLSTTLLRGAPLIGASVASENVNFIVFQPDDFWFFEEWDPPAHLPGQEAAYTTTYDLPHINQMRANSLRMTEAYASSPHYGTSRHSTVTGRFASRSAVSRDVAAAADDAMQEVYIPTTKLHDVATVHDGNDCTANNLAAVFKANGYNTGVTGKWHLFDDYVHHPNGQFDYSTFQKDIRECGFDYAEALYAENLNNRYLFTPSGGDEFSHNLEYIADKTLRFLDKQDPSNSNFFLYVNPTAPHTDHVAEALDIKCNQTPEGVLSAYPDVDYVVNGETFSTRDGCAEYRATVRDRLPSELQDGTADRNKINHALGSIWVDDLVGVILQKQRFAGKHRLSLPTGPWSRGQAYPLRDWHAHSSIHSLSKPHSHRWSRLCWPCFNDRYWAYPS